MDNFIGFAGIGTAIIASMGLAMWMEWYCLRWLMRLMPGRAGAQQAESADASSGEDAEYGAMEPELEEAELVAVAPAKVARPEIRLGI